MTLGKRNQKQNCLLESSTHSGTEKNHENTHETYFSVLSTKLVKLDRFLVTVQARFGHVHGI